MGVIKVVIGDAILTSIWVFSISMLRILTANVAVFLGLQPVSLAGLFITTILNTFIVFTISLIGRALGGASFNPSTTVTFYTAGLRPDSSLASMAVRFPAQAAGGAVGAKAILLVMPTQYKHMLKGPSLKVALHTGAMAEGALTFTLNLVRLFVMLSGPKNPLLKVYLLAVATVALVIPGSGYQGFKSRTASPDAAATSRLRRRSQPQQTAIASRNGPRRPASVRNGRNATATQPQLGTQGLP